jgi:Uma2 family endonuclease
MATGSRFTAKDLWERGEGDQRQELVDGQIIEMAPPGALHGRVTGRISFRLADYVRQHAGGEVLVGDAGFILRLPRDPERVRGPDVAFVSDKRLPGGHLPEGFLEGAPDLAVEVLSPGDNPVEVQQRVRDFLEGGARLVWVVAPRVSTVTVYRADGPARLLMDNEVLDGEDVLPGLTISLGEVF